MSNPIVIIETNFGDITAELFPDESPTTVENFLRYADDGFYDATLFHRVIPGFMIQGGGFDSDFSEKSPAYDPIENEASASALKNLRGKLAMARTSDPHSATTQFFINLADNNFLNYVPNAPNGDGYAVFGKVTSGMEIVDKIAEVETSCAGFHSDVPVEAVMIKSIKRQE